MEKYGLLLGRNAEAATALASRAYAVIGDIAARCGGGHGGVTLCATFVARNQPPIAGTCNSNPRAPNKPFGRFFIGYFAGARLALTSSIPICARRIKSAGALPDAMTAL